MAGSGIYTEDPVSSCAKSILPGKFSGPIRVSERKGNIYERFHLGRQTEKGIMEWGNGGKEEKWERIPPLVHYLFPTLV